MRALNGELLQKHSELQQAGPDQAASVRAQAAPIIAQRAEALSDLIAQDPQQALALAFSEELLAQLAAAFPDSASQLESRGAWEGPIEYLIFDNPAMTEHRSLRRMQVGSETLEIYFAGAEPDGLKSGDLLLVSGMRARTRVAAAGGAVTGSNLPASSCSPTGVQNAAVLLVTFPGVPPPNTAQSFYNIFFGTSGRSLDGYWREASYNAASLTGNVFGWYTLDTTYTCDQYSQIQAAAIKAADPDVNFLNYNRVFIVFPKPSSCSYGGLGTIGCTSLTSADGSFTASTAWLIGNYMSPNDQGVELVAHEGGHNLTLSHARSRDFGSDTLGPLGASGTISEYGDNFSSMGYWNLGHYAAPHKLQLGWLASGSNVLTVQSSGTYSIQPLEISSAGVQALKVQRGTGNNAWVWIEYRKPTGNYDTALSSQVFSGALIHYQDSNTGSGYTDLLDYTPATSSWTDPSLANGKTWVDPYTDLSVAVTSATSNAVTVSVSYGAAICTAANPTVTVSPLTASVPAGSSVTYSVAVTNNDSISCSSGTFSLSSVVPSGWTGSLAATSLTINPGQSGSTSLTVTPPLSTTAGSYSDSATATKGSLSGTGSATTTVTAPCTAANPTVALSPSSASVLAGSSVSYTVSVTNNDSASCSAGTFSLSSTVPAGWSASLAVASLTISPGQSAATTISVTPPLTTASGTYSLSVNATKGTYSGTGSTSCVVTAVCTTANPTVAVSPANPSVVAGNSVSYTVTVTNQDSSACSAATFTLSSSQPSGWGASFAATALTIGPGQSASTTLSEAPPSSTAPGTYAVSSSATRGSNSGAGPASCTVMAPLTASVSVPSGTYTFRSTVSITAKVMIGTSPAAGASVKFTLVKSDGSSATKSATTDSTGQAAWSYRVGQKDPKGTYSVSVQATYSSQTATAGPATFTVQ
ncbi:MAG: hypothetical protein HY238_12210 [Acidobacteria bacterium]|nr:hypothetical protein [Acidobacteriota bacterium]